MKKRLLSILIGLLFLPVSVQAASFMTGDNLNVDTVVNDDLYGAAEVVRIFSEVRGDLLAAGGKVDVEGAVSQDLMAAGGEVNIRGEVSDDVRTAGGTVRIDSTVKGDVMAAGGSVTLSSDSFVGGDVNVAGGNLFIGGGIGGDLRATGDEIRINSTISGSVKLYGFDHVSFGPDAKIAGDLSYKARESIMIPDGVVAGTVDFKQIKPHKAEKELPRLIKKFSFYSLLATLFFGLFFIWLYRYFIIHSVGRSYEATLKSLGVGFLTLILTPAAILILLATAIGVPLALVVLLTYIIALFVAKIMAAMLIGFKIVKVDEKSKFGRIFGAFFVGALIYSLIALIPVFGWIVNLLFVLIALGGMVSHSIEISQHLTKKKLC